MRFTPQNAGEMAAKSHAVRKANFLLAKQAISGQPIVADSATAVAVDSTGLGNYSRSRLVRLREQLDLIDAEIRRELKKDKPDGQQLNWLCAAQDKLAEQERVTDGRPSPGSFRPTAPARRSMFDGPTPKARPQLEQDGESERAEQE